MIDHQPILNCVKGIPTATSDEDKHVLIDAIESAPDGDVLEIGIYYGANLVLAARELELLNRNGIVWGIDPLTPEVDALGNPAPGGGYFKTDPLPKIIEYMQLWKLNQKIVIIQKDSREMSHHWTMPLAVLVVDGCHTLEYVLHDLTEFSKWVVPGGVILAHDYDPTGIKGWGMATAGIEEFAKQSNWEFEHLSNYAVFRRPK